MNRTRRFDEKGYATVIKAFDAADETDGDSAKLTEILVEFLREKENSHWWTRRITSREQRVHKREIITRGDIVDIGSAAFYLFEGKGVVKLPSGEDIPIKGPDLVGEMALLTDEARSASVVVDQGATVYEVPAHEFYRLAKGKGFSFVQASLLLKVIEAYRRSDKLAKSGFRKTLNNRKEIVFPTSRRRKSRLSALHELAYLLLALNDSTTQEITEGQTVYSIELKDPQCRGCGEPTDFKDRLTFICRWMKDALREAELLYPQTVRIESGTPTPSEKHVGCGKPPCNALYFFEEACCLSRKMHPARIDSSEYHVFDTGYRLGVSSDPDTISRGKTYGRKENPWKELIQKRLECTNPVTVTREHELYFALPFSS